MNIISLYPLLNNPDDFIYPWGLLKRCWDERQEPVIFSAVEPALQWAQIQGKKVPQGVIKYLQPEWQSKISSQIVYDYVLKNPQWRVSLQTHKFIGVR